MTEALHTRDSLAMAAATASLAEQVEAALEAGSGLDGLPEHDDVENVVVLGMGGSGIAGDLVVAVASPFMAVPVTVVKSYAAPAFVGEGTLVFAVSFSGDTEETVEAAGEAADEGARVVVVSSGGELGRLAEEWGAPHIQVPSAIPQPRAAIGAMAIPMLVVLEEVGLFPGARQWVVQAAAQLRRRREELFDFHAANDGIPRLREDSVAAEVARRIGRTMPLVHGAGELGATAAKRWKAQINENAKTPAFCASYPELCHNEIAGWGQLGDVTRQVMTLVNLRYDGEHPQVVRRFALVREIMSEVVGDVVDVRAAGEGDLAQLLDLFFLGDVVSLHLAASAGVDPGPVPILQDLKARLKEA